MISFASFVCSVWCGYNDLTKAKVLQGRIIVTSIKEA